MKSTDVRKASEMLTDLDDLRQRAKDIEAADTTARVEFVNDCGDCICTTDELDDEIVVELRRALARHTREQIAEVEAVLAGLGVEIVPEHDDDEPADAAEGEPAGDAG